MASFARPTVRPWARPVRVMFLLVATAVACLLWLQSGGWAALADRDQEVDGPLLVNAEHPLPADLGEPELVGLAGKVPVAHREVSVAAEIEKPLLTLFKAARKAGLKNLYVASGYRTAEEQRALWEDSPDRSYVQPPGHSEHQTGLAVDLADLKVGAKGFGETKAGRWLARHSWKYGFLLRYPAGKEEITGISYEPWHFRYVGRDVAEQCHDNEWTLEEYVAAL
ncbi:MAG: M15 family metallopeptidase [Propionicimonas sp.]